LNVKTNILKLKWQPKQEERKEHQTKPAAAEAKNAVFIGGNIFFVFYRNDYIF